LSHASRLPRQLLLEVQQRRSDDRTPAVNDPHTDEPEFPLDCLSLDTRAPHAYWLSSPTRVKVEPSARSQTFCRENVLEVHNEVVAAEVTKHDAIRGDAHQLGSHRRRVRATTARMGQRPGHPAPPMSHFVPMQSLDDLAAQLRNQEAWDDELVILEAVTTELHELHPRFLAEATGEWKGEPEEGYLVLAFTHDDGTVINVVHGDGFTAIQGGSVNYRGWLDTSALIDALTALLRGRLVYACHSRLGRTLADYFELVGHEGQRLGFPRRGLALRPWFLRSIPLLPVTVRRVRLSFDDTPAISVS